MGKTLCFLTVILLVNGCATILPSQQKFKKVEMPPVKIGKPSIENWCASMEQIIGRRALAASADDSQWQEWNAFLLEANKKGWELILVQDSQFGVTSACFKREAG